MKIGKKTELGKIILVKLVSLEKKSSLACSSDTHKFRTNISVCNRQSYSKCSAYLCHVVCIRCKL